MGGKKVERLEEVKGGAAIISQGGAYVHRTKEINTFSRRIAELGLSSIDLCGGGAAQS